MREDNQCLREISKGSELALETLYGRYAKSIHHLILSYTKNEEDAEEILQDVFVTIFLKSKRFKSDSTVKTWVYRIAVNRSLDHIRKKNSSKRFGIFTSLYKRNSSEIKHESRELRNPRIILETKEDSALLLEAIEQLSENQQTAFILTQIEDLSQLEAAEIMGISRKAVESLVRRAKYKLRITLEKNYPEWRDAQKNTSNK